MLRYFLICLLVSATACTSLNPTQMKDSQAQRSLAAQDNGVYLNTNEFPSEAQTKLMTAAEGKWKPTLEETQSLMDTYSQGDELKSLKQQYADRLYNILNIDPKKPSAWKKANAEFYKGIRNYVGDSGEGGDDPDPSWQTINGKLREGTTFNAVDQQFYDEILFSLTKIPVAQGLAFRGIAFTAKRWSSIETGKEWHQSAFTSTTLDPEKAAGFGRGFTGYSRTGVLILKLKSGGPVSPLTFDHGVMGQPGRFREYELLLAPGANLFVHHKIENGTHCYLFAEEM